MKGHRSKRNAMFLLLVFTSTVISAQTRSLDEFEGKNGWTKNISDGVTLELSNEKGLTGNAIRFDYDFTKGTGYAGIQKLFPVNLPDNLSLIHISEPTRRTPISYAVFCL